MDALRPSVTERVLGSSTFGKYRLIAELGAGGMANVFLAVMRGGRGFNKLVVLKVPRDTILEDPGLLAMFLDEARLAARLNHRNVVQTYEVFEEAGRDVIVMEYLDGQTLNEVLVHGRRASRVLPVGMHLRVIVEALNGLHYAHELKDFNGRALDLVHRDVSPHNIFITADGQVKMLDFGVAKAAISTHQTQVGTFKGKVRYMPPEQFAGAPVDRRTDIFAMGAVLWEAAVGKRLWQGVPEADVVQKVVNKEIPMPRDVAPDVDERLDAIVRKALAYHAKDRYATCLELKTDLDAYLDTQPVKYSVADVSGFVTTLFADTQARRRAIIEDQLNRASLESTGDYHVLPASALPMAPPSLNGLTSLSGVTPTPSPSPAANFNLSQTVNETGPMKATAVTSTAPPAKKSPAMFLVLGGVAIVVLGVAAFAGLRGTKEAPAEQKPVAAVTAPTTTPADHATTPTTPANAEMRLVLEAFPKDAKLFLDDQPLASNPITKTVPKDGASHTLRAEAKGYATKSQTLQFDADKSEISLALEKDGKTAAPAVVQWQPAPAKPQVTPAASPVAPSPAKPSAAQPTHEPAAPPGRPKRPDRAIDDKL